MNTFDYQKHKSTTFWLLHASGWGIYGILHFLVYYFGKLTTLTDILAVGITFLTGFIISLLLRYIYRDIGYKKRPISYIFGIVILSSAITANFWYCFDVFCSIPFWGFNKFIIWFAKLELQMYFRAVFFNTIILLCWSALYFVINFWIEWKYQTEQTEKANLLAESAQLQMLRYQLNPHFLFNALNSIRALIEEDKILARTMVTELAEFLRYALISKTYRDVPLSHEIEAIRHYFAIEKKRYEDKLEIELDIESQAEDFPVLSFLIHPLVENAVKYGMRTSTMPLKIQLKARVISDSLHIQVCNSGSWFEHEDMNQDTGTKTGIDNVKKRLENAFPEKYEFKIIKEDSRVCVFIVLKRQPDEKKA